MDLLLVCAIVVGAVVLVACRLARRLREPTATCCGCETCSQPEELKRLCALDADDDTQPHDRRQPQRIP